MNSSPKRRQVNDGSQKSMDLGKWLPGCAVSISFRTTYAQFSTLLAVLVIPLGGMRKLLAGGQATSIGEKGFYVLKGSQLTCIATTGKKRKNKYGGKGGNQVLKP